MCHQHTPHGPQSFTVARNEDGTINFRESRGVQSIERVNGETIVTLIPGDGDERSVDAKPVRLLIIGPGVGEILDEESQQTKGQKR